MANVPNIARSRRTEGKSRMLQLLERFAVTRSVLVATTGADAGSRRSAARRSGSGRAR